MLKQLKYVMLAGGSLLLSARPDDTHRAMSNNASYDDILSAGTILYLTEARKCEATPAFTYTSKTTQTMIEEVEQQVEKAHDTIMRIISEVENL